MRINDHLFMENAINKELEKRKSENDRLRTKVNMLISDNQEIRSLKQKINAAYICKEQFTQIQMKNKKQFEFQVG